MTIMNRHKKKRRLGVAGTVVLIFIRKKQWHSMASASRNFPILAQDRIIQPRARNTSHNAFVTMLSNPNNLMEGRFEQLELGGHPVQIFPYPTFSKSPEIEFALDDYDYRCDPNAITKSQLQNIPSISNFISSADHCRITKDTLEYCLCGKQGCIVCAKIRRGVRTPDISIKGNNI